MAANRILKDVMVTERDKLHHMYHQENQSLTDIGQHYGCTRQYVQLIFKELGIERRSRMLALRNRPRRRKSKYNFTEDDDRFIVENYDNMSDPQLAERLSKPVKSVIYRRLIVLGRKKVARRNFSPAENQYILNNYLSLTDSEIAKSLSRSLISVTHHRNRILNRPKREGRSPAAEGGRKVTFHQAGDGRAVSDRAGATPVAQSTAPPDGRGRETAKTKKEKVGAN